jgi:hypothetical protein
MIDTDSLLAAARADTGLSHYGAPSFREGLDRLVAALGDEADLSPLGQTILSQRIQMLLVNRLRIEATYEAHPEIADETVRGPIVIVGLPRTGTTALSQLVAADPQVRSLRLWESTEPVPPPEAISEHDDPRIAGTQRGLDTMYRVFPRMASLYFQTATGATECQDLLGMEFRTTHFDGMAHIPSYTRWAIDCDMAPAYVFHRRTLRLLQWHCPPSLWHLKTPVHMLHLDALATCYPDARFLWTHRDPAEVMGSVCSLVAYTRSWVSDRPPPDDLGAQQLSIWSEALRRALAFRERVGEDRFADVPFAALNRDPVGTVAAAYSSLGLTLNSEARSAMAAWAGANARGSHGAHDFSLEGYGLDPAWVRAELSFYLDRFESLLR